jgi:WD40 repeat protein
VVFSPDGTTIASGSADGSARIFEAATGRQLRRLKPGHGGYVWSVAFSPDGTAFASGSVDKSIRIWDATVW